MYHSTSELPETGGAQPAVFDFQLRPVGRHRSQGPFSYELRFKDFVSITNRAGKFKIQLKDQRADDFSIGASFNALKPKLEKFL